MAEPQDPQTSPPAPDVPFWQSLAKRVGIDVDAINRAGRWVGSKLPQLPPELQAAFAREEAAQKAREATQATKRQATWDAIAGPVGQVGQKIKQGYQHLWTPDPNIAALADQARQGLTARSDVTRAALPHAPGLQPLDWMVGAQQDWLPNMLVDQAADASTPVGALANADLPIGPALKAAGGAAAHLAALPPGFYSRVDRIAEAVGQKGIHPNKLASLLKAGASGEEVAYRGLPELIASKGNQLISKDELAAHLAAHPPPEIGRTVLGASTDPAHVHAARDLLAHGTSPDDALTALQQAYRGAPEAALRDALDAARDPSYPAGAPKYSSYTLPGGENYRESLTTLRGRPANPYEAFVAQLEQKYGVGYDHVVMTPEEQTQQAMLWDRAQRTPGGTTESVFRSSHWEQPNILVHTRTNERTLPPAPMRSLPEIEQIIQDVVGAKRPEHIASGGPQMAVRQGLITHDEAALYGQSKGFTNYPHAPTGPRGRFLEEVQGDWPQQGKKLGYQGVRDPADAARVAELTAQLEQHNARTNELQEQLQHNRNVFLDRQEAETRQQLPQQFAQLRSMSQALDEGRAATDAWRTARTLANQHSPALQEMRQAEALLQGQMGDHLAIGNGLAAERAGLLSPKGVPDMPFKETWPDLALKQQLLDVANRQDLSWLGFTSGKTQAARYDLSKQISRLEYDPNERRLIAYDHAGEGVIDQRAEPDELDDYIGKEPADKLRAQIDAHEQNRAYDRAQWTTEIDPETGLYVVVDPNGEVLHHYSGNPELHGSERAANDRIDSLHNDTESPNAYGRELPHLEGLDLQVGGEGMTHFYDQLLPKRLEKLVKPFGGTVERGAVPAGTEFVKGEVPGWRVVDSHGTEVGTYADEQAARYVASQAAARLPTVRVVPTMMRGEQEVAHSEPAWIARLSPEAKEQIRAKGFPLMSFLPPAVAGGAAAAAASQLGGDEDHPGGAGLAAAALPFALPRGGGTLAKALKRTGLVGEYALRAPVIERLARLYEHGQSLPPSSWGGPQVAERLLQGFDNDADLARQWSRLWGATSPNTSVPVNTRESVSALAHSLLHPDRPLTYDEARSLPGAAITMAASKVPNINRALEDLPLSGDKVEAMAGFMTGQPRIPIDVHALYALGAEGDKLDRELPGLRTLMTRAEGVPRSGGLTNTDLYSRTEEAIGRALRGIAPRRKLGATFAQTWEGTRGYKGLAPQGAPADILGQHGLLETGALLDPERIRAALAKPGWTFKPR